MAFPVPVPFVLVSGVPTDSVFQDANLGTTYAIPSPPRDGVYAFDVTAPGTLYVRRAGTWQAVSASADLRRANVAPTDGAVAESFSRSATPITDLGATGLFGGATGGTINVVQVPLVPGDVVTNVAMVSGATAANGPTHQWAGICDSNRKVLAVTADQTNAALAANAEWKFALTAPLTVTARQTYYAFAMWTASTAVPSFSGKTDFNAAISALAPVFAATSSSGQTTPPAVGATLGAFTGVALAPYVALS